MPLTHSISPYFKRKRIEWEKAIQNRQEELSRWVSQQMRGRVTHTAVQREDIRTEAQMKSDLQRSINRLEAGVNPDRYSPVSLRNQTRIETKNESENVGKMLNEKQIKIWREQFIL